MPMRNLCQNLLLSYTQFKRLWTYIKTRTVKDRTYYRYVDGVRKAFVVHPKLGEKASRNGRVVYDWPLRRAAARRDSCTAMGLRFLGRSGSLYRSSQSVENGQE